ncbi:hypothetical protein VN1064_09850 [Helicobacter pylori]
MRDQGEFIAQQSGWLELERSSYAKLIAQTIFKALAKDNINIMMISTSEIKISVLIDIKYAELAVRTLHAVYQLDQ